MAAKIIYNKEIKGNIWRYVIKKHRKDMYNIGTGEYSNKEMAEEELEKMKKQPFIEKLEVNWNYKG